MARKCHDGVRVDGAIDQVLDFAGSSPPPGRSWPRWRSRASQLKSHADNPTRAGTRLGYQHGTQPQNRRPATAFQATMCSPDTCSSQHTAGWRGGQLLSARPSSDPCAREAHGPKLNAGRLNGASAREPLQSTGAAFLKMPKKQLDTAFVAQVHQLAADGHSVRRIAKALDIPRSSVGGGLDWRRTAAVATRAPSRPPCASARRGKDYRLTPMMAIG